MSRHHAIRPAQQSGRRLLIAAAAVVLASSAGIQAASQEADAQQQPSGVVATVDGGDQLSEAARSRKKSARVSERASRHGRSAPSSESPATATSSAPTTSTTTTPTTTAPTTTAPTTTTPATTTAPPPTGEQGAGEVSGVPGGPSAGQSPPSSTNPPAAPTSASPLPPAPGTSGGAGPQPVDLTPQGATSTATGSVAGIVAAINAAPAGSTVLIPGGSYGALAVNRQVGAGSVQVQPVPGSTVTIASVNLTGSSGLDWRGINTTAGVRFQNTTRTQWRGGTHSLTARDTGFLIHSGSRDITVEDVVVRGADCSFYLQAPDSGSSPSGILLQRFRSEAVHQDHVFISRGSATIQDFVMQGHTESAEHQDGVQIVGGKDVLVRRGTMSNDRAFRDGAGDRNDHGVMINYTPGEGRVPENIVLEDLVIHDMTSTGVAVAGVRGLALRRVHAHDNGPGGRANDLVIDPDPGNVVTGFTEAGCTFAKRSVSGVG